MNLFLTRQMHEAHLAQRIGPVLPGMSGGLPLGRGAQMDEYRRAMSVSNTHCVGPQTSQHTHQ